MAQDQISEPKLPWGRHIRISIYVEGELPPSVSDDPVVAAAQAATKELERFGATVAFAGAAVGEVEDEPKDSG